MGIDEDLRAAQERQRSAEHAEERKQAEIEQKRLAYHAEEDTTAAAISAAIHRAHGLLDTEQRWIGVDVFAPTRFPRSDGKCDGRILSLPHLESEEFVLFPNGYITRIQRRRKRHEAEPAITIDQWSANLVRQLRAHSSSEASTLYDDAFSSRWPDDRALSNLKSNLGWVRSNVQDAVARMLTEAEVHL
jgi:hypothetical protein